MKRKSVQEMEESADELTSKACLGVLIILLCCVCLYGFSILVGWLVAISMGG